MDEYQRAARVIFATGLIAMGVLGLVYGDFAMQWQPVPSSIPWHSGLAYLCAAIELVLGLAFLIRGTVRIASRAALVFVALFPSDSATSFTRPKPPRSSPPGFRFIVHGPISQARPRSPRDSACSSPSYRQWRQRSKRRHSPSSPFWCGCQACSIRTRGGLNGPP